MDQGDVTQIGVVDLKITGETQGDILYFNGSNWVRLAPGTADQSLRTGGAGANPAWEAVDNATDLSIASQTTGDILYYNGANWVRLAGGTSGDVLTANGAGVAPSYQTAGGGLADYVAGSVVEAYGKSQSVQTTATSFTKIHEISDLPRGGTIDVKFLGRVSSGGQSGSARVYVNGVGVGTTHGLGGTSFTEFTTSGVTVSAEDNVQLYVRSNSVSWGMHTAWLRVFVANPTTPTDISVLPAARISGTGVPNNSIGSQGDIYQRTDGGVGSTLYYKSGASAWTAVA
jgi:hypothetical protein